MDVWRHIAILSGRIQTLLYADNLGATAGAFDPRHPVDG